MNKIISINGTLLTPLDELNEHVENRPVHVTEEERTAWNAKADVAALSSKADMSVFNTHKNDSAVHITEKEREMWNGKQDKLTDEFGNMMLDGELAINGSVTVPGVSIPADVLQSLYWAAAHYYAIQYGWTRENILRDFCGDRGMSALPDDMPEPSALAALTDGTGLFKDTKLTRLPASWTFPALTTCHDMFWGSGIEELTISSTAITSCFTLIYQARNCKRINMDFSNVVSLSYMAERAPLIEFRNNLKCVTNVNNAFKANDQLHEFGSALPKVKYAQDFMCWNSNLTVCRYPVDANGQSIYESGQPQDTDEEGHGLYAYLTMPELINGINAFHLCQLDLPTSLSIINSLREVQDGISGATWKLTIGIHVDHKDNADLLTAIEAATSRGWTITAQYNGIATAKPQARALRMATAKTGPIWCKAFPDSSGDYISADGMRYMVEWGHYVSGPGGCAEELEYRAFDNVLAALAEWGLTEQAAPPVEELYL